MKKRASSLLLAVLFAAVMLLAGCSSAPAGTEADPTTTVAPTAAQETAVPPTATPEPTASPEPTPLDVDTASAEEIEASVTVAENTIDVLLVGLVYDETLEADRAEACMVVSYNREAGTVKMASLVTDIWTPIEGFDEGHLDEAYADGGIDLLMQTVNADFGLALDTYAIMNFDEFTACIDQLGGLTMDLSAEEASYIGELTGTEVSEGESVLTGTQALAHVRNRYVGDGDFARVDRQRELLSLAYSTLRQKGSAADYLSFLRYALGNVTTNMSVAEILKLGLEFLQAENMDFSYARMPVDDTWEEDGEADGIPILRISFEKNAASLQDFLYGVQ
jgi:LCP family protein required for cell wall assembly